MGVRLVMFDKAFAAVNGTNVPDPADHNLLINRDMKNQHPIWAISGLQDVLNELEDLIKDTNSLVLQIQEWCKEKIADWQKQLDDLTEYVMNIKTLEHVVDTDTVDMHYDNDTKTLSADVKVFPDDNNAVQALYGGIFVPKVLTKDTNTVRWQWESNGETLAKIFEHGEKFSHGSGWNNETNIGEMNSWYWSDSLNSFVQPQNTNTYNGFITEKSYDYYVHRVTIVSTDSDDDMNGIIIGYVKDDEGKPHTLTAMLMRTGLDGYTWEMCYDLALPDQQYLARSGNGIGGTTPGNYGSGGWSGRSILVEITKEENIITAMCSNWGQSVINEDTKITINLDNYSWGHLFRGKVKYGYSNWSQANSYFQNIYFKSRKVSEYNIFQAYVKISEKENNDITEESDGIWSEKFKASAQIGNILEKKADGWYVPKPSNILVSKKAENVLTQESDGLYVPDPIHTIRKKVTQSAHGFIVGDFIYYHHSKKYQKALALDDYDINIVGIVVQVTDVNNFEYQWAGFFKTNLFTSVNGFVQGMPVYISDVNAGKVVQKQPDISKAVGYPVEDVGIVISIERGIQYNQEASFGDFKKSANTYNIRSDGFIRVVEGVEYKQSLTQKLLDALDAEFKANYIRLNNTEKTFTFINTSVLYAENKLTEGMNLFIKAF